MLLDSTRLFSPDPADIRKSALSKDAIAEMLKVSPETLAAFEASYQKGGLGQGPVSDNFFEVNSRQASAMQDKGDINAMAKDLNDRIIDELLGETRVLEYDGETMTLHGPQPALTDGRLPVTREEVLSIPVDIRPQLTGRAVQYSLDPRDTSPSLLAAYTQWKKETDPKKKAFFYGHFRQGLDILDLDGLAYEMLGTNPNAMGYWLPAIVDALVQTGFFKIPKTKVMKVPLTVLQLSRLEYGGLTPGTMDIVDRFCFRAFGLDEGKDYFIKTGTFSSKYDFRNAKVMGAKEVRELGEYLLFIQNQAVMMAGPLTNPCIYGVSTTNEWVVREFIHDVENNPCIYKGLPLHTEYRVFVDADEKRVLGINPYWDPDVMKQRFGHEPDAASPHNVHDYIIYKAHEDTLMFRYHANKAMVLNEVKRMLPFLNLSGQWSIDVMQNGDDFWIIDMALAEDSSLKECVPAGLLRHREENWLPAIPEPNTK